MVYFQRVPEDSLWEKTRYITLAYLAPTFIYNYRHFLVLLFESEVFKILTKGDSEKSSGIYMLSILCMKLLNAKETLNNGRKFCIKRHFENLYWC